MAGFATNWRKRELLRIDEVCELISGSRSHVYDLLSEGELIAHHRSRKPGVKGIRIVTGSVVAYIERGQIPTEIYSE